LANAFKAYRKTTIDSCRPFLSPHFNRGDYKRARDNSLPLP
jgi:hypothetical protein